jgi:hypothetical protein
VTEDLLGGQAVKGGTGVVDSVRIGASPAKVYLLYAASAIFSIIGLFMVFTAESVPNVLFGILSIVLFGGGALYAGPKLLSGQMAIEINEKGIRPRDGGFLPWENVSATGAAYLQGTVKCLGIRIVDYAAYASTFSHAERQRLHSGSRLAQGVSYATMAASISRGPEFFQDMLKKDDRDDLAALASVPGGTDLGRMLAWNRKKTEWDLVWPQSTLDRKVAEIVGICSDMSSRRG